MKQFLRSSYLLSIVFMLLATSCQKEANNIINNNGTVEQKTLENISYGHDAAQTMDVYLPANRSANSTNIILFIHGGSWSGGDKTDFNDAITAIRSQLPDFAIFNINYRLATGTANLFPVQLDDIDEAINFINSNTKNYLVNCNKIIIVGASAGAQLGLLKAYKDNLDQRVKAVIDLFGPTDLVWMYFNHPDLNFSQPVLINFLGISANNNISLYQQASPINYVTAQSPPTQIFQGTADAVVPASESETLQAKLQLVGVKNELIEYEGEGHGWTGKDLTDTYNKAIDFIKANVQ